ncbi:YybH family protein [Micromonospora polyrhachis]|uniref:Ketosteroid isomerase-like protein n=1 Tax=Micromonospora polyrhachis TaxID=1282883 RepID=A0A7W7WQN0_9ACTN|nr:nuclear transport factor 2 family protein [Micromonospora polyrhachis]MBB4959657.1 ketosteroid isomerase-like protein [Micromonospora polyrhachis]
MTHSTSVPLATEAAEHPHAFARAFNTFDPVIVDRFYEPAGVFVPQPGVTVSGLERLAANARFLEWRVPIRVAPRHIYVSGDLALFIVDYVIEGTTPADEPVRLAGTATDVGRCGSDGRWRYVIDNPFGVARPPGKGESPG